MIDNSIRRENAAYKAYDIEEANYYRNKQNLNKWEEPLKIRLRNILTMIFCGFVSKFWLSVRIFVFDFHQSRF